MGTASSRAGTGPYGIVDPAAILKAMVQVPFKEQIRDLHAELDWIKKYDMHAQFKRQQLYPCHSVYY
jgi:hypothetical protein